jgi:uncharacterized membrane protein YfcA
MDFDLSFFNISIVCLVGLVMGVWGAILGSTMFVLVPLLNYLGLPIHAAIGTAKLSIVGREITPIFIFGQSRVINARLVIPLCIAAAISANLGALLAVSLDGEVLKKVVGISMATMSLVAFYKKDTGIQETKVDFTFRHDLLNLVCGILIGFYSGIFGGGTNIFIIFLLVYLSGNSFLQAVANSKLPNILITAASLPAFIGNGHVIWKIGIPLTVCTALGSTVGAKIALKKGSRLIRYLFLALVISLAITYLI